MSRIFFIHTIKFHYLIFYIILFIYLFYLYIYIMGKHVHSKTTFYKDVKMKKHLKVKKDLKVENDVKVEDDVKIDDKLTAKGRTKLYTIIVTHNNYKLANYKCNIISFYDYC